jgi:hypothetical protein
MKLLLLSILSLSSIITFSNEYSIHYQCQSVAVKKNLKRIYTGKLSIDSPHTISVQAYKVVCTDPNKKNTCKKVYERESFDLLTGVTYFSEKSGNKLITHESDNGKFFNAKIIEIVGNVEKIINEFNYCKETK